MVVCTARLFHEYSDVDKKYNNDCHNKTSIVTTISAAANGVDHGCVSNLHRHQQDECEGVEPVLFIHHRLRIVVAINGYHNSGYNSSHNSEGVEPVLCAHHRPTITNIIMVVIILSAIVAWI